MNELSPIFETQLSTNVFLIGDFLCMLAAIVVIHFTTQRAKESSARLAATRFAPLAIGAVVGIAAVAGGFKFISNSHGDVIRTGQTLAVDQIMRRVDVKSLPVQFVAEPY